MSAILRRELGRLDLAFLAVALCFVLSGFAALLYQTAWMRQFSLVFGTSEVAVATVLAAYMAGLALGSWVAGRLVGRVRRPVLVYGVLELGIALAALAVPFGLDAARALHAAMLGGAPEPVSAGAVDHTLFFLAASFAIIVVPTALMGATLPILSRDAVRTESQIGSRVGVLYAANTAGAVAGTWVAAFVLLPRFGLSRTVLFGVATNALVFLLAAGIARSAGARRPVRQPLRAQGVLGAVPGRAAWMFVLIALSGSVSFTYEVLWSRLLSHVLGSSVYAFATMLASFLAGITLGSAVAARLARTREASRLGFVAAQLGTAVTSLALYLALDHLPQWTAGGARAWVAALTLLPSTVFIGATFPFALRVVARDEHDAPGASGRLYAWNTAGAIAGALSAGFFVIPALGYSGTLAAAVSGNVLLAAAPLVLGEPRLRLAAAGVAALTLLAVFLRPAPPEQLLRSSSFGGSVSTGRKVFESIGRTASVLVLESNGVYYLRTNGMPEANLEPRGAAPPPTTETHWMSMLPVLARPQARSMLMIGLGGGVALERVPPSVESIDCIELEPEVVAANRFLADRRFEDPLADPRLTLVLNDGRGALEITKKRWDIVVSQPSHPWSAGASHLYTREFLELVADHLTEGGVFLQWISPYRFLDAALLRSLTATLLDVFPHVRLYRVPPTDTLLFLGSGEALEVEGDLLRAGSLPGDASFWSEQGILGAEDVAILLAADHPALQALSAGAPVSTDDRNLIAMRASPRIADALVPETLNALLAPLDPLVRASAPLELPLDWVRVTYRLVGVGWHERAWQTAQRAPDEASRALAGAIVHLGRGQQEAAAGALARATELAPSDPRPRYLAAQAFVGRLPGEDATRELRQAAHELGGAPGAVLLGFVHAAVGDWDAIAELEGRLADARPGDFWYHDTLRMRSGWRVVRASSGSEPELAREALELVDRSLAANPDVTSLLIRLQAALAIEEPAVLVESADDLALLLRDLSGTVPPALVPAIRQTLARVVEVLPTIHAALDDARRAEIEARLREVAGEHAG